MDDPAGADDLASQLAEERATVAALTTAMTTSQANLDHALQRNVFVARELERDSAESMRRLEKLESTITDLKGERRDLLALYASAWASLWATLWATRPDKHLSAKKNDVIATLLTSKRRLYELCKQG